MKRLVLWAVVLAALGATPAFADPNDCNVIPGTIIGGGPPPACYFLKVNPDGSINATTSSSGTITPSATTSVGGTVTTHAVFQSALAASGTRKGCSIQNTSSDVEYVGAIAVASATTSNTFSLNPGDIFDCTSGSGVPSSTVIAITSKTTDGSTYVVMSQ